MTTGVNEGRFGGEAERVGQLSESESGKAENLRPRDTICSIPDSASHAPAHDHPHGANDQHCYCSTASGLHGPKLALQFASFNIIETFGCFDA